MDLYKQFETDERKEVEGAWVALSATARIKVARMGNPRYRAAVKRLSAPYRTPGLLDDDIPDEVWQQITKEAVAEAILVDWEGVTKEGAALPYSKHEALALLTARKDFYGLVMTTAQTLDHYRVRAQATIEKN
jgi:hypothetical protein